jgi:hypothetical protein
MTGGKIDGREIAFGQIDLTLSDTSLLDKGKDYGSV